MVSNYSSLIIYHTSESFRIVYTSCYCCNKFCHLILQSTQYIFTDFTFFTIWIVQNPGLIHQVCYLKNNKMVSQTKFVMINLLRESCFFQFKVFVSIKKQFPNILEKHLCSWMIDNIVDTHFYYMYEKWRHDSQKHSE